MKAGKNPFDEGGYYDDNGQWHGPDQAYYRSNVNDEMDFPRTTRSGNNEHLEREKLEHKLENDGLVPISRAGTAVAGDYASMPREIRDMLFLDRKTNEVILRCMPDNSISRTLTEWKIFFPGVMVHELSHFVAAKASGLRVYDTALWKKEGYAYVTHDAAESGLNSVFISTAPLVFGSLLSAMFFSTATAIGFSGSNSIYAWVLGWLGISIALHAPFSSIDWANVNISLLRSYTRRASSSSVIDKTVASVFYYPLFQAAFLLLKISVSSWYWVFFGLQYLFIVLVWSLLGVFGGIR